MTKTTHRIVISIAALLAALNLSVSRADEIPVVDLGGLQPIPFDGPVEFRPIWPGQPIINPGEIRVCRPIANPEYREILTRLAASIQNSIRCGNAEDAVENAVELTGIARQLAAGGTTAITGNCFSKKNCDRPKLTAGWVSQAECKAAGGDSWQQQNPTTGTCINL